MKIHVDKISSSTKNLRLKHAVEISRKISSVAGAVIAVRVLEDKKIYNQLELPNGRMSTIQRDDILIVTLGNRRALKGFVGEVPKELKVGDIIHLLNLGGVAGICTSANRKEVGKPLKIEVLGALIGKEKETLNIENYKLFTPAQRVKSKIPLIVISGSCMNVGKTTVASEITKSATRQGYEVSVAKVAGIAALRDTMNMQDYGAIEGVSMIDAGFASTAKEEKNTVAIAKGAINYLSKRDPDFIVMELGDGIFGEYGVMEILQDAEFKEHISAHIGCASDPLSAAKLFEVCRAFKIPLHLISGPATDNTVGIDFIKKHLQVHAINCIQSGEKIFDYLLKNVLKS